jgi:hypothetical protein
MQIAEYVRAEVLPLATADASLAAYTGTEPAFEDAAAEWYRPRCSDTGLALDRVLGVLGGPIGDAGRTRRGGLSAAAHATLDAGFDGQGIWCVFAGW